MRDAFENGQAEKDSPSIHNSKILAAAQWILWNRQTLFKHIIYPGDISSDNLRSWRVGALYHGEPLRSLDRWHFWRDCFKSASSDQDGFSNECKDVAAKVAGMIDSFEQGIIF
jgi:hypothetical protein